MTRRLTFALLAVALAARGEDTVEHTRKNIHVLQGLPESQLFMAMNSVAQSLGVHCDYCHVKSGEKWIWESDEKQTKVVAREMITMTRAIKPAVTCYTCHRGSTRVFQVPPLPPFDPITAPPRAAPALPSAGEIVKRYLAAVGGGTTATKKTAIDFAVQRSEGRTGQVHLTISPARDIEAIVTTAKGTVRYTTETADASADQLRRTAAVFDVVRVTESPDEMKVLGIERIGDREVYAVGVRNKTYFFDVQTALLRRELSVTETLLAPLPQQVDYDDYRDVDGAKRAFSIRTSDAAPYDTATYVVRSIQQQ